MRNTVVHSSGSRRGGLLVSGAIILTELLYGLGVHALTVAMRDHGPAWDSVSLRGDGAIVVPLVLGVLGLGACILVSGRRQAWIAMAVGPIALFAGLVVIAGGF